MAKTVFHFSVFQGAKTLCINMMAATAPKNEGYSEQQEYPPP
jgi:hypothetical protein